MNFLFDVNISTPLCEIMGKNKSDKGDLNIKNSWHNYTTFYYSIFKNLRLDKLNIFELGLGTNNIYIPSNMGPNGRPGASLYGWRDFFINSNIYGADIDTNILFNDDRIYTYFCDQTNIFLIRNLWNQLYNINFDIMIDDGLHEFNANVCFFENSIHKLNKNGYYIIEDILKEEIILFNKKIDEWKVKYPYLLFNLLEIPSLKNNCDNNLLVIYHI